MKNQWVYFFLGYVTVKVTGKGLERLVNRLSRRGINIWNLKRIDQHSISFHLSLNKIHPFRRAIRKSDWSVYFIDKHGLPFIMKHLFKNGGFVAGLISFFLLMFLLSNMIWGIEIEGAEPKTEERIWKELDKLGVEIGSLQILTDSPDEIQRILTNNIPAITWVGVKVEGTIFKLQVVEKNQPKQEEVTGPQNLVAAKKAIIVKMYVQDGQPIVSINDYVRKGQKLVSGEIGTDKKWSYIASKGEIIGQTWYNVEVSVPLKKELSVMTGDEKNKYFLQFGTWNLQIWGFGKPDYKSYHEDKTIHPFKFLRWELPIRFKEIRINEVEKATHELTEIEAVQTGIEIAKKDLLSNLGEEAKIIKENILHKEVVNGKVKLKILFTVHEDIAKGQPIIQGD